VPPAEDGEVEEDEEEEDNHSSDSDFSAEERPRTRGAPRGSKRRIQVSSSDSSGEEQEARAARVKREPQPSARPGGITKAREVMSRIRERGQQTHGGSKRPKLQEKSEEAVTPAVKKPPYSDKAKAEKVLIVSGSAPKLPAASETADTHRRPSKQQQQQQQQQQRGTTDLEACDTFSTPYPMIVMPFILFVQFPSRTSRRQPRTWRSLPLRPATRSRTSSTRSWSGVCTTPCGARRSRSTTSARQTTVPKREKWRLPRSRANSTRTTTTSRCGSPWRWRKCRRRRSTALPRTGLRQR